MGFGPAWSVVRLDESLEEATDDYLKWAAGQAQLDLANGYALGMPKIRMAAKTMVERIAQEQERRKLLSNP